MPTGGGWDTGTFPQYGPPTCAHGVGWANPCAACGRGYPSPYPATVVSQVVDLTPLIERLDRIEKNLMSRLDVLEDDVASLQDVLDSMQHPGRNGTPGG